MPRMETGTIVYIYSSLFLAVFPAKISKSLAYLALLIRADALSSQTRGNFLAGRKIAPIVKFELQGDQDRGTMA